MKEEPELPDSLQASPTVLPDPISKTKLIVILIAILILLITASTLGYLLVRRQAAIKPDTTNQPQNKVNTSSEEKQIVSDIFSIEQNVDIPSSWETYSSTNMGFTVSYPPTWVMDSFNTPTLTIKCDYESGDHCPHLLFSKEYSIGDELEDQYSFNENASPPQNNYKI